MTATDNELEALRKQAHILQHINESVISMDLSGFITGWNSGAERLFGYSAAEVIGRNVLFLYADENEEDASFEDAFLDRGGREMEVRRRKKMATYFGPGFNCRYCATTTTSPAA